MTKFSVSNRSEQMRKTDEKRCRDKGLYSQRQNATHYDSFSFFFLVVTFQMVLPSATYLSFFRCIWIYKLAGLTISIKCAGSLSETHRVTKTLDSISNYATQFSVFPVGISRFFVLLHSHLTKKTITNRFHRCTRVSGAQYDGPDVVVQQPDQPVCLFELLNLGSRHG